MHHHHFKQSGDHTGFLPRLAEHVSRRIHAMKPHGDHSGGRSGRGFGGGGDFGGGDGFGSRDGFTRGRKFSSEDLQLLLLALLAEKPAHGYELIKALELRTNGFYTPSPGMVYPALTYLEELAYVAVELHGNRKSYSVSEQGKTYLAQHQERVTRMFDKIAHIAAKMDSLRRAYSNTGPSASSNDTEHEGDQAESEWQPELIQARRAIKSALIDTSNATKKQQLQVAQILLAATEQINAILKK